MAPEKNLTESGGGDGNRTHVRNTLNAKNSMLSYRMVHRMSSRQQRYHTGPFCNHAHYRTKKSHVPFYLGNT